MSYILDALKKLEHERKRRVATPELLIFDDIDSRTGYRNILKYLLISSVIVNMCLLVWWLGTQKQVRSDEKVQIIQIQKHEQATVVSNPKHATDKIATQNEGKVHSSMKNATAQPKAGTEFKRLPEQRAEKKTADKNAVFTIRKDEPAEEQHISGSQARMLRHDDRVQTNPNVRVWEDEHGNMHFSGTAGGN